MTLGDRIRTARNNAGLSQVRLAEQLGVAQTTLSAWERNINEPSRDEIRRLANLLSIDASEIEALPTPPGARTIGVMGYVGAGQLIEPLGDSDALDHIIAPPTAPAHAEAAIIRGTSMQPVFRDGNVIIWWNWYEDPRPILGIPSVCRLEDGRVALKMVEQGSRPGLWTLLSINQFVSPMRDVRLAGAAPVEIMLRRADWV